MWVKRRRLGNFNPNFIDIDEIPTTSAAATGAEFTKKKNEKDDEGPYHHTSSSSDDGSKVLMDLGFYLTLLNMILALLPVTIRRRQVNFCWCSISKIYSMIFLCTLLYATYEFISLNMEMMLVDHQTSSVTELIAIFILKAAHIVGFLAHILLGQTVARNFPKIWNLLSIALQKSVVNLQGKNYKGLKVLHKFSRRVVTSYVVTMVGNECLIVLTKMDDLVQLFSTKFQFSTKWQFYLLTCGYILWDLSILSHVLISSILSLFAIAVGICLKCVNEELIRVVDKIRFKNKEAGKFGQVPTRDTPLGSANSKFTFGGNAMIGSVSMRVLGQNVDDDEVEGQLNYLKDCYAVCEDVTSALSSAYGKSIFVEVLILSGSVLANLFLIFSEVLYWISILTQPPVMPDQQNSTDAPVSEAVAKLQAERGGSFDGVFDSMGEIVVNFSFFYSLTICTTKMVNEARRPLRILKDIPYSGVSSRIQSKLQDFKSDVDLASIKLTAADYFEVNKSFITSVCGSILTFLIVLIQFKTDEMDKGKRCSN